MFPDMKSMDLVRAWLPLYGMFAERGTGLPMNAKSSRGTSHAVAELHSRQGVVYVTFDDGLVESHRDAVPTWVPQGATIPRATAPLVERDELTPEVALKMVEDAVRVVLPKAEKLDTIRVRPEIGVALRGLAGTKGSVRVDEKKFCYVNGVIVRNDGDVDAPAVRVLYTTKGDE